VYRKNNRSAGEEKNVIGWHPLRKLRYYLSMIANGIRDIGASRL
jgi:hypothetical protein